MQITFTLIPYIKFRLGGPIISKHTFSKYNKSEIVMSTIVVIAIYIFAEYRFNSFGLYGALLVFIYMFLVNIVANISVLVTNKGFYYQGKYSQWKDIVSIHGGNANCLIIEKVSMVRSKQKIKDLSNKKDFLEIAKEYMTTKP